MLISIEEAHEAKFLKELEEKFEFGSVDRACNLEVPFIYCGTCFRQNKKDYSIEIDMAHYVGQLSPIHITSTKSDEPTEAERKGFRSLLGGLAWATTIARPDEAHTTSSLASQMASPTVAGCRELNTTLERMKQYPLLLRYRKMNFSRIAAYVDAAFSLVAKSNYGHVGVFVGEATDSHAEGAIWYWFSKRLPRVASSSYHAEVQGAVLASEELEVKSFLAAEAFQAYRIPHLLTDSLSLIKWVLGECQTNVKGLFLQVQDLKERCLSGSYKVRHVDGTQNCADVLTKSKPDASARRALIKAMGENVLTGFWMHKDRSAGGTIDEPDQLGTVSMKALFIECLQFVERDCRHQATSLLAHLLPGVGSSRQD